jgi:putative ABC transport system permease protein
MGKLYLLTLILKRFRAQCVLGLLSLAGVALTVGVITSIPVFSDSVGFQILKIELERYAFGNLAPPLALRYYRVPSAPEVMSVQQALDTGAWLGQMTAREVGLPIARVYTQIGSHALTIRAPEGDPRYKSRDLRQIRINCVPGAETHVRVLEGEPLAAADDAALLYIWVRPDFLDRLGLGVGEEMELFNFNAVQPEVPLRFRVAGTWEANEPYGPFWYRDPHDLMAEEFLTSVGAFGRFVAPYMPQQTDFSYWYYVLDMDRLRFDDVDRYVRGVQLAQTRAESTISSLRVDRSPIEPLLDVQVRTRVLKRLLYGFSLPIIALLLFFSGTISAITVRYQQRETAILMSRGASRVQVLLLSLGEGLFQIALGLPLGLLACLGLARVMGLNSSFLAFDRPPLPLATQALDWRTTALALFIALLARLIPTMRATRQTIVSHGRERARATAGNTAIMLTLNLVLIAVTYYAHFQLKSRGTLGMVSLDPQSETMRDPLIFIAPALFILTSGWLLSQVFPLLLRIPDALGGLLPGVSVYMGLRNLARHSGAYTAPLFLLTICLCLGSFEASIAKSADTWLVDRLQYQVGADYTFAQAVETEGDQAGLGSMAWLLPPSEYERLPRVEAAARVGIYTAIPTIGQMPRMRIMGVDRLDFSRVVYWRADYAAEPLGALLNKLGAQPDGILVTRKFLDRAGLGVGDRVTMDIILGEGIVRLPFVIVGTFDHFPTMYEDKSSVAVANLETIFEGIGGVDPHSIWLRTAPDIDPGQLREQIRAMRVVAANELDSRSLILEDSARLERVGIFGNLSAGFLAGTLVAWLGLLIHTFASLAGRIRIFTITRAIGMSTRQVLAIVSLEYLIVTLYGVLGGAAAGVATSLIFVRYFQFTENPSIQMPPFVPEIALTQIGWIIGAYLAVLLIAEGVVLARAIRSKIFQALRMGDEE